MTWTKLGDEFLDDTEDLTADAGWLHVQALVYSSRKLLDLHIPKRKMGKFAHTHNANVVDELIEAGFWRDDGDSWYIGLHRPEWQQDRVQVERERDRKTEDQRRRRLHNLGDHSRCHPNSTCPTPAASPSRPDPVRPGSADVSSGESPRLSPGDKPDVSVPAPRQGETGWPEVRQPGSASARAGEKWASGYDR